MRELIPLKSIIKDIDSHYDLIITSGRGGMMASQFVAYARKIKTVHVVTNVRTIYPSIMPGQSVLIVDDINDSGATISYMIGELNKIGVTDIDAAVLYERYNSMYKARYVGERISHDDWLEFTWDKDL